MRVLKKNNGITDVTVLKAAKGKVLRRKDDGFMAGDEIWLGYSYWRLDKDGNNIKRDEPLLELPEHYEEIPEPVHEEEAVNETIGNEE